MSVVDRKGRRYELGTRPDLARGDRVVVEEPNIAAWSGRVGAIKPAPSGWRVEVDGDAGVTWSVIADLVRREETGR